MFLAVFDWILFILAGNENIHKSLDEFCPDLTTDNIQGVFQKYAEKSHNFTSAA